MNRTPRTASRRSLLGLKMAADTTLDLGLRAIQEESKRLAASIKPGRKRYDVIVVGSGAAGGMASYLLTAAGLDVLMLEAGRLLDERKEYRTMEWPYASPRRNRLPPGERAIEVAEYTFADRPYGLHPSIAKYKKQNTTWSILALCWRAMDHLKAQWRAGET